MLLWIAVIFPFANLCSACLLFSCSHLYCISLIAMLATDCLEPSKAAPRMSLSPTLLLLSFVPWIEFALCPLPTLSCPKKSNLCFVSCWETRITPQTNANYSKSEMCPTRPSSIPNWLSSCLFDYDYDFLFLPDLFLWFFYFGLVIYWSYYKLLISLLINKWMLTLHNVVLKNNLIERNPFF